MLELIGPRKGLVAVLAAGAVLVPATAGLASTDAGSVAKASKAKTPSVTVADDYYSPESVNVKAGSKVKFKWDGMNTDEHNVTLQKGPSGVKKKDFTSATGSIGIKFAPTFEKKGTYQLYCTIHPGTMQLTVKVSK